MADGSVDVKKPVSLQKESDNVATTEKQLHETEERKEPSEQGSVHNNRQCNDQEAAQGTVTMEREKDASTVNTTEEQEYMPIRHPKLPVTSPPRYFVNKDSVVCSNSTGKLRALKQIMKGSNAGSYTLYVNNERTTNTFKLEEIMAYTFSEHFDSTKHYIFHKDGNHNNCDWNNLVICDLPTLQKHEIARLEKEHPGTRYTVVRNVHDTLTFERYLVSDTGSIYSLIRRIHLRLSLDSHGYSHVCLACDTNVEQPTKRYSTIRIRVILLQSFEGRRQEGHYITYINGNKDDNVLGNLAYTDPAKRTSRPREKRQPEAEKQRNASREFTLPPVTDETKWKTIGTLLWNGLSFSQYEVSDMGHVRKKDDSQLLKLCHGSDGQAHIHVHHDQQSLEKRPKNLRVSRIVANAFVDGYSETQNAVEHINGDRLDNRAQNLKWVPQRSAYIQRRSRPVVASLMDNPEMQKRFPSISKAQQELSVFSLYSLARKHVNSFTKEVNWDGEKKLASIQVFLSKKDQE